MTDDDDPTQAFPEDDDSLDGALRAAASTIRADRSTPRTLPSAPTASAACNATRPVPLATSSTLSPGASDAVTSSARCTPDNCVAHSGS